MRSYMQSMANILNGTPPEKITKAALLDIDPDFVRVYRNNSVSAFADVLRANYSSVEALVGPEYFKALTLAYLEENPCRQRTLVGYGEKFPRMINHLTSEHNLPYLSSFAQLDHAWTLAHLAADTPSLALGTFVSSLGPNDDLLDQFLTPKPDMSLIELHWPVFDIWTKLRDGQELEETIQMNPREEKILLWRYENEVTHRALTQAEFIFLGTLFKRQPLGKASQLAQTVNPELDINQLLVGMINAQLFMAPTGDQHD